jgi:peptide/nickel transport system substrate-binding protein
VRGAILAAGLVVGAWGGACDTRLSDFVDPGPAESEHRGEFGTLIVGSASDAIKLDPARVTDNESVSICEQIYEHLVRYAPTSTEVEPSLARSWEVSPDGTVWTFHLREGVKFQDGTPLDADAVVFSFERQRDPFHPNHESDFQYWDGQYRNIEKIRALDPLTVEIKIERSYAPFLTTLAMFPVSIVSPAAVRRWGAEYDKHPVGTGPFRFATWIPGDRIVLERNDAYWGEKPQLKRIVFRSIPDARQRLVALEGGAIDVAFALQPSELQYVQLHPDLHLHRVAGQNVAYVAMNTRKPPFDNVAVRRAINHAINKEPIVKLIYQGLGVPARGPVPPSIWSYRADLADYEYDPARARAMLQAEAAAGRLDLSRKYTFYVPRTPRPYLPEPETVARFIQRNLQEVGFQTNLVIQDFYPHLEDVQNGRHEMCLFGWAGDNGDPDNFLYVLFDRDTATLGTANNVAFFDNAELHGILIYAQETSDREDRTRFYEKAQEIVHREAPWVPLAHSEMAVATRDGVNGFAIHPSSLVYYRTVWLRR